MLCIPTRVLGCESKQEAALQSPWRALLLVCKQPVGRMLRSLPSWSGAPRTAEQPNVADLEASGAEEHFGLCSA